MLSIIYAFFSICFLLFAPFDVVSGASVTMCVRSQAHTHRDTNGTRDRIYIIFDIIIFYSEFVVWKEMEMDWVGGQYQPAFTSYILYIYICGRHIHL